MASRLPRLMLVDRRLHRGARLIAGAGVFGLGVVEAPVAQGARNGLAAIDVIRQLPFVVLQRPTVSNLMSDEVRVFGDKEAAP